ncbi:DUF89 domain-containing protein [Thermotoga sp. SG1]|uniref:damage-control phosphatase ARMT1 family protein n=1 Tax=Thermotoga sp. SG1 TaxID=126739 RepID=UPI00004EAB10|nr:DUF89 domain-containing protein [Thermotoga sp. SG1]PLV57546.1 hypothetical protein AS006_01365 [Thermotoga sp. SG1]CAI44360.1 hypothetical protein [Thermotoga sp. SG1]
MRYLRADERCLICSLRQAENLLRKTINSPEKRWVIFREIFRVMSEMKWGMKPLEVNGKIHRFIMEYVKEEDPFKEEKERSNEIAMKLVEMFRAEILNSPDPVYSAAKLAVSGNLIDLGIPGWKIEDVFEKLHEAYERPFDRENFEEFRNVLENASTLFYIADNAGEIVFDKFFIEVMKMQNPSLEVMVAVRGKPIINDVTVDDAKQIGLEEVATLIDSGVEEPGVVLDKATPEFRRMFFETDLVISKGQGNFEGLYEEERENLFFLLTAKCDFVAEVLKVPVGGKVFISSSSL